MKLLSEVNEAKDLATKEYVDEKAGIKVETDPVFSSSPSASITSADISKWNGKQDTISDLSAIRSGAALGATALQSETYRGTVTGVKMNDSTKSPSNGVVDLGTVITSHQQLKTINGQSLAGSGNITIGGTPRIEMTASSAALEPNKFYVWDATENLNLTLVDGSADVMNRYMFQFRTSKAAYTILQLPEGIMWSNDTEKDADGMPVIRLACYHRVEIIEGLATLKSWSIVSKYISFEDAEVERVLIANGVGTEEGIFKSQAAAVTTIGAWFRNNTTIVSFDELQLFTGVHAIANYAFSGCTALEKIGLGDNITTIGAEAFNGCSSLSQDIIVKNCTLISTRAFKNSAITRIEAPAYNDNTYGQSAFEGCSSLTYADISNQSNAFGYLFSGCTSLEEVKLKENVHAIGAYTFSNCTSLKKIGSELRSVTSIGTEAFANCSSLAVEIYLDSFTGNYNVATKNAGFTLIVFSSATSVSAYQQFLNCANLRCVLYGKTVSNVGTAQLYNGCSSLEALIFLNPTPPTLYSAATLNRPTNCPIYVPDASVEAYKSASNWANAAAYIKGVSQLASDDPELFVKIYMYI